VNVLAFDTATAATVVGLRRGDGVTFEARHDPFPRERPGHATRLLALVEAAVGDAGLELAEVERIGVGTGPGSFTGLRIGVATARALAQGQDAELVGISTPHALAAGAIDNPGRTVAAVLDARRGEAFAAAWRGDRELLAAAALGPDALAGELAALPAPVIAVGEGAVRFRSHIEPTGAVVPPDDDPLHRLRAAPLCRLAVAAESVGRDTVLPDYLRAPDAEVARRERES
jgi:tRNA threonylcarbamoyladenosine biosynthesis protein TsaB